MKVTVSISGAVSIDLSCEEVRHAGIKDTMDKWLTPEAINDIKDIADRKALEYLNAIGELTDEPITSRLSPEVLEFEEDEYLPAHVSDDYFFDNRQDGMWTCSNCGAPNSVSQDQGCTSCDH
jgi:hypothetical protein